MKIAYINSFYPPHVGGGAEITLSTLVQSVKSLGHEVVVICTGPEKGISEEFIDGIRVLRVGINNYYWHYMNVDRSLISRFMWHFQDVHNSQMGAMLERVLRTEAPDVVSCHVLSGWSISVWEVVQSIGVPILQVLHDMYLLCAKSTMYRPSGNCESRCIQCSLLRSRHAELSSGIDSVVGISKFILDKHLSYGYFRNSKHRHVIHNTRSYPSLSITDRPNSDNRVKFGFIGTLSPEKGVEWLLKIFSHLSHKLPIELYVAGQGKPSYTMQLISRFSMPNIYFLGKVNPIEYYPTIDALIVPSMWNEPLGMVVPEALAHAVPVLASRSGGLPEMISDGQNGYLFSVDSTDDLIKLLTRIANKPTLIFDLREAALQSSKQYIDSIGWGRKYVEIYERMVR